MTDVKMWETSTSVDWLVAQVTGLSYSTPRKYHLLACACVRYTFPWTTETVDRNKSTERAEKWVDGCGPKEGWGSMISGEASYRATITSQYCNKTKVPDLVRDLYWNPFRAIPKYTTDTICKVCGQKTMRTDPHGNLVGTTPKAKYCISGSDPDGKWEHRYRLECVEPWMTVDVIEIAQEIYSKHKFDSMPILGDALEDGGCIDLRLLQHCRDKKPHAKGCWLLDIILGHR